jgi:pimeloyl-ACP methyl ester carboxylesterase
MPSNSNPRRTVTRPEGSSLHPPNSQYTGQFEQVDPRFLLKSLAAVVVVALVFTYITMCVVFSKTQWQIILHPSRTLAQTPMSVELPFSEVHFGVDATGEPQLDGWWIASDTANARTVLMLHSAIGSMSDALTTAQALHAAHLNVFLFDYRGYGHSGGAHPTQELMQEDAHNALEYLKQTRQIPEMTTVIYGRDLGASLALQLCATAQGECPALILDAPDGDVLPRVQRDTRSAVVPVSLLFNENFALAAPLQTSTTPKLLISYTNAEASPTLKSAKNPKMLAELRSSDDATYINTIVRFLGEYNPQD